MHSATALYPVIRRTSHERDDDVLEGASGVLHPAWKCHRGQRKEAPQVAATDTKSAFGNQDAPFTRQTLKNNPMRALCLARQIRRACRYSPDPTHSGTDGRHHQNHFALRFADRTFTFSTVTSRRWKTGDILGHEPMGVVIEVGSVGDETKEGRSGRRAFRDRLRALLLLLKDALLLLRHYQS